MRAQRRPRIAALIGRRLGTSPAAGLLTALATCTALAGCGGGETAQQSFPPLHYGYLTPLRLNVGNVTMQNNALPGALPGGQPGDMPAGHEVASDAPEPPDQALQQMAHDRLVAAGNSGTAVFTVDHASIVAEPGGALDGSLAVHLDVINGGGGHVGYAEAHVSRQFVASDNGGAGGTRAMLYALTRQMMDDMNVEFEFQLRRTLKDWMVDASGAPVAGSVQQQSLPPPGAAGSVAGIATPTATPIAPAAAALPSAIPQASPGSPVPLAPQTIAPGVAAAPATAPATAPQQYSPQPGFLHLPGPSAPPQPSLPGPGSAYPPAPVSGY